MPACCCVILYKIKCVNIKSLSGNSIGQQQGNIGTGELRIKSNNSGESKNTYRQQQNGSERSDVQLQLTGEITLNCEREAPVHGDRGVGSINTADNVEIKLI